MASFYPVPGVWSDGSGTEGRAVGNNAAWTCRCGEVLLGPHEGLYPIAPCPGCERTFRIVRGTAPRHVERVAETTQSLKGLGPVLTALPGAWRGTNRLWMGPDAPALESETTAAVEAVAGGSSLSIHCTWAYEGTPQDGLLAVRLAPAAGSIGMVWIDSWHTGKDFMSCRAEEVHDARVSALGSYGAPPGPDWGWRIAIECDAEDAFRLVMHNIHPEGQEMLAVEATYKRVS